MALRDQIKKVNRKVGTSFTILRDAGNVTGEYTRVKINQQVTKPFIREFFHEAIFDFDTSVLSGDYVQLSDGRVFIVMSHTPKAFKDVVYQFNSVLYRCNAAGRLLRPAEGARGADYKKAIAFPVHREVCHALITESLYGNELEDGEKPSPAGQVSTYSQEFYVPTWVGVQVDDRYEISASEYYRVTSIKRHRFDAALLCILEEDTR